jgi:histidinol-phosphate aminotransferase
MDGRLARVSGPRPADAIARLPLARPFIAPEELARRSGHARLLRLGANESAFGPPPAALASMRDALELTSHYGDPEAAELREALAREHACDVAEVTVGAGIDDLLGLAVRAYLAPGDVTVATLGTYPTYAYHVTGYGARLETVPYAPDGAIDLPALAELAHARRARIAYLANPDNPSGFFAAREAVGAFLAALPADCLLVLDEAYADYVPADQRLSRTDDPRVVRMRTFSKAYGLAGARIAYALAAPEVGSQFNKIRLQYGVNRTAQIGALAALASDAFVATVVRETERGRDDYERLAASLRIGTLPSRTNFVCFDLGSRERAERMVDELLQRGVFVRKPSAAPLDRYVRVTVGTPAERERFAEIFTAALAALPVRERSAVP